MALGRRPAPPKRWWDRIPARWHALAWLCLFLLLSRLLYLPWSQAIAASDQRQITAPPNTAIVLEGVGQGDATVLTLQFDEFRNVKLDSPHAALGADTLARLGSMAGTLPPGSGVLSWNVNLPPHATHPGLLRVELAAPTGKNVTLGTLDGTLQLRSNGELDVTPTAQDYDAIGGWLKLGGQALTSVPDLAPTFQLTGSGDDPEARARISFRAKELELLLGDPFGDDDADAVPVRSVALVDEAGQLVRRLCGAPQGRVMIWSTLFQPRLEPQPDAARCKAGNLAASGLRFVDGSLVLGLRGTAFVPGFSRWLEKLKANIVLWPIIAALIAIPGTMLWKSVALSLGRQPTGSGEPH